MRNNENNVEDTYLILTITAAWDLPHTHPPPLLKNADFKGKMAFLE